MNQARWRNPRTLVPAAIGLVATVGLLAACGNGGTEDISGGTGAVTTSTAIGVDCSKIPQIAGAGVTTSVVAPGPTTLTTIPPQSPPPTLAPGVTTTGPTMTQSPPTIAHDSPTTPPPPSAPKTSTLPVVVPDNSGSSATADETSHPTPDRPLGLAAVTVPPDQVPHLSELVQIDGAEPTTYWMIPDPGDYAQSQVGRSYDDKRLGTFGVRDEFNAGIDPADATASWHDDASRGIEVLTLESNQVAVLSCNERITSLQLYAPGHYVWVQGWADKFSRKQALDVLAGLRVS